MNGVEKAATAVIAAGLVLVGSFIVVMLWAIVKVVNALTS